MQQGNQMLLDCSALALIGPGGLASSRPRLIRNAIRMEVVLGFMSLASVGLGKWVGLTATLAVGGHTEQINPVCTDNGRSGRGRGEPRCLAT